MSGVPRRDEFEYMEDYGSDRNVPKQLTYNLMPKGDVSAKRTTIFRGQSGPRPSPTRESTAGTELLKHLQNCSKLTNQESMTPKPSASSPGTLTRLQMVLRVSQSRCQP